MTAEREGLAEEIAQIVGDLASCHSMWIGDDGEPLDYLPEREKRISDFVGDVEEALADLLAARDRRVRGEAVAHERVQQADRLQSALGQLDSLKHQTERVTGKRQGVALALSYIEEDQRMDRADRIEAE